MITLAPGRFARGVGVSALVIGWAVLAHATSASEQASDLELVVALSPLAVIAGVLVWRTRYGAWLWVGVGVLLALLASNWGTLRQNASLLYYLQHAGSNLFFALLFGRSLAGPGEALVTRFARFAHYGSLSPEQIRYTRQVTAAWTIFFVALSTVSTALFVLAPTTVWSIFANLLTMPLLGVMFAAEFIVRHRVLPPAERTNLADTLRGYRESVSRSRSATSQR